MLVSLQVALDPEVGSAAAHEAADDESTTATCMTDSCRERQCDPNDVAIQPPQTDAKPNRDVELMT